MRLLIYVPFSVNQAHSITWFEISRPQGKSNEYLNTVWNYDQDINLSQSVMYIRYCNSLKTTLHFTYRARKLRFCHYVQFIFFKSNVFRNNIFLPFHSYRYSVTAIKCSLTKMPAFSLSNNNAVSWVKILNIFVFSVEIGSLEMALFFYLH